MLFIKTVFLSFLMLVNLQRLAAQELIDSASVKSQVPVKYVSQINNKIEKYSSRLTSKTEKTLTKLSRWERKIHTLLQKANPEAAERLFGNGQPTFQSLLQKVKVGETLASNYTGQYDSYVDNVSTTLKYLQEQKSATDSSVIGPLKKAGKQMTELQEQLGESSYTRDFIKERKKQLFKEAAGYIGKSKYLSKINKESYYYVATLSNYKEIFSDPKKTEEAVKGILDKIPAFQKFVQKNSQLASLFGLPENYGTAASLTGLQTRASVQSMIQQRIAAGGPNAAAQVHQNVQGALSQLSELKEKLLKSGAQGGDLEEMPDFKPNGQKSKTMFQRLEYGLNVQFSKNTSLLPSAGDVALSLGYKINDKSSAGVGASYKVGLGTIEHIQISSQGLGLRSYVDWKPAFLSSLRGIGGNLYISGGYEMNYNSGFKRVEELKDNSAWQRSGLIGISKKMGSISSPLGGKRQGAASVQLLYDFLARDHVPVSQPVIFRIAYMF